MEHPSLKNLTTGNFGKPAKQQNELLKQLGSPHTSSFNYMTTKGLNDAIEDLDPVEFKLNNGDVIKLVIDEAHIKPPVVPVGTIGVKNSKIMPRECRQRQATYQGMLVARIKYFVNGREMPAFYRELGEVPIMIKSNLCHLNKLTPSELVKAGEHEQEWGGYFIVKGHERLIRMLLLTRRNYPITVKRKGWMGRGELFSEYGVQIRCVAHDQTATSNVLHYVKDGTAKLMFSHKKNLYYVPLIMIMKCLTKHVDVHIYRKLLEGFESDQYYSECIMGMLRELREEGLQSHEDCLEFFGKMFRPKVFEVPEWKSDREVGEYILKRCILIHLDSNEDKFNLLCFMTKKLFNFSQKKCLPEGADSVMVQELLLGGHLYQQYLKERLQKWLIRMRVLVLKYADKSASEATSVQNMNKAAQFTGKLSHTLESFLATGNVSTSTGLGLMQEKGLTIVPENINRMRYMSHFRSVHRGAFFLEMRTTEARQLLPEHWGFVCPVHTPDGAPCGLLNHLTMNCIVSEMPDSAQVANVVVKLCQVGMILTNRVDFSQPNLGSFYHVQLDGKLLGYIHEDKVRHACDYLRILKLTGKEVPNTMEIVLVPKKKHPGQFPGVFLFTGPARMLRPVIHLKAGKVELIGTLEQVYLDIAARLEERYDITTHLEISETTILSNLALLIPMPECNQSPRNMYQCQMGKQTMGTPCHNWGQQAETKLYRLQNPQSPLFRPLHYDKIQLDEFPMGTNAIVAVISYTGYDMEDAIVINKMSEERGLAHGSVFKTEFIEVDKEGSYFFRNKDKPDLAEYLDNDGLPYVGRKIHQDEPLCCFYSEDEKRFIIKKYHSRESAYVDSVRLCGDFCLDSRALKKTKPIACVTYRIPRNPSVGDKFASRAGQKGILAKKWGTEDLPWTETGLIPDIIFNPHGFPSRMTIAMMIEVLAGKSGALHGFVHDASPWKFDEKNTAFEYFGKMLEAAGYNYYGNETMYSGIDGRELEVQIFFGVVHYQRLRHMVADKWQVRAEGPMDILTRQPLKGRQRGGGIRFGEMERDALIAHGCSFLLQDRLLNCSDRTTVLICTKCESLLSPISVVTRMGDAARLTERKEICRLCNSGDFIGELQIPYIFKFFVSQLASINVNLRINTEGI